MIHTNTISRKCLKVVRIGSNIRDMKALLGLIGLLAAALSGAQFGGMGMDMMYGPMATLQRPEIRKELKVSKDQVKQLDEIVKNLTKVSESGNIQINSLSKVDADMMAVLDEVQKQRYFELSIQIRGAIALTEPLVVEKLGLNVDQAASAKKIRKATQDKVLDAARKGSRDSKLMENASKALEKELTALLTDDQKKAFTELAGVIFKGARMKGVWPI